MLKSIPVTVGSHLGGLITHFEREPLRIFNPDDIDASIVLYDLQGREILNRNIDGTEDEYPTQNIPAGVYPFTLIGGGQVIGVGKWVKAD